MKYVLTVLLLLSQLTYASDYYLYTGGFSQHFKSEGEGEDKYNENNQLIGVEFHTIVAGTFKNTYNDRSFYIGRKFFKEAGNLELGIVAGATYGYYECYGPKDPKTETFGQRTLPRWCPLISPYAVYRVHKYFQPALIVHADSLVLSLRWDLGNDK
jgi:hypothetical protein